ncbi:hypothetical protein ACB092_07G124700 [Castanea dentata]
MSSIWTVCLFMIFLLSGYGDKASNSQVIAIILLHFTYIESLKLLCSKSLLIPLYGVMSSSCKFILSAIGLSRMSTGSSSILMAHHWKTWDWQERLLDYSRTLTNVMKH